MQAVNHRHAIRGAAFLLGTLALFSQHAILSTNDPAGVLARARVILLDTIDHLQRYTCAQAVTRNYFEQTAHQGRTCDDIVGDRLRGRSSLKLAAFDRLRLNVEVADSGLEIYSWPGAKRIGEIPVQELAAGHFGTGAFGPFLINIFATEGVPVVFEKRTVLDGKAVFRYRFRVPLESSHYRVYGGGVWHPTPYDGTFWLDPGSAELRRLTVRTGQLPRSTGACEATTTLDFERMRIGEGDYLLPKLYQLQSVRRDASESNNVSRYSACREFRGESALRFEDGDGAADRPAPSPTFHPVFGKTKGLPPGLLVSLAFEKPIETDTAAAGDNISATVLGDIVEMPSKRVLMPAGARVRGRITHFEQHVDRYRYFLVGITFDTIEFVGESMPFSAKLNAGRPSLHKDGRPIPIISYVGFTGGGTLVFPAPKTGYVVPAGYRSEWVTSE